MLTERDKQIIDFITSKGEVEFREIKEAFFPTVTPGMARERLRKLEKWGRIRVKHPIEDARINIYYV
jgi:DNA-binding HxlR family transcriptional regulator